MTQQHQHAVIYSRVSSLKQSKEGAGLASQRARCMEYAKHKRYLVVESFEDDMSGSLVKRPGINAMLKFLRHNRSKQIVVIIDDISRLARGIDTHYQLRDAIARTGARIESPSHDFGEDSDSILVENLLASVSQHQRQKNSEQVRNRMRSRLLNGFWPFKDPLGYKFERSRGNGKILVRDEPIATILADGLNRFASGNLATQSELKRFYESFEAFPKDRNGEVRYQRLNEYLTRVLYAGYVEAPQPDWNVSRRPGAHEPLISYETFTKIQERMNAALNAPARKNIDERFPLRGFVHCSCGTPLRSCFSKGRSKHYAYYLCQNKSCEHYGKSIKQENIEGEFETLLSALVPLPGLLNAATKILKLIWERSTQSLKDNHEALKRRSRELERDINGLVEKIMDSTSPTITKAYERKIHKLEEEKLLIEEKLTQSDAPQRDFNEITRTALKFLSNPLKLWRCGEFEDKRAVLRLSFSAPLTYDRNSGYRTAAIARPFRLFGQYCTLEGKMVGPPGLEPGTNGFATSRRFRQVRTISPPSTHHGVIPLNVSIAMFVRERDAS